MPGRTDESTECSPKARPRHVCLGRSFHRADLLTLANAACGVGRLARYGMTTEPPAQGSGEGAYFAGSPIPTGAVNSALLARLA